MQSEKLKSIFQDVAQQRIGNNDMNLSAITKDLNVVRERNPGITMLMLSTSDGRALAESSSLSEVDARRLAAIANSFLTLGETVAKEVGFQGSDYATVCTRLGNVVLVRVAAEKPLTLTAVGNVTVNMAVLLFTAKDAALRLSKIVN